jgi:hypothetical protein
VLGEGRDERTGLDALLSRPADDLRTADTFARSSRHLPRAAGELEPGLANLASVSVGCSSPSTGSASPGTPPRSPCAWQRRRCARVTWRSEFER